MKIKIVIRDGDFWAIGVSEQGWESEFNCVFLYRVYCKHVINCLISSTLAGSPIHIIYIVPFEVYHLTHPNEPCKKHMLSQDFACWWGGRDAAWACRFYGQSHQTDVGSTGEVSKNVWDSWQKLQEFHGIQYYCISYFDWWFIFFVICLCSKVFFFFFEW